MDRTSALAMLNGRILAAYSASTVTALRAVLPLRLALPHLEPVLALNVEKEIRKDSLVIRHAGAALATGRVPDRGAAERLFAETQAIDRDFVTRVDAFPVRLVIPYAEIQPLRVRRIERLLEAAYRTLDAWRRPRNLRAAVRTVYARPDFERLAGEVLDLYARETRVLTRSVRLPLLLEPIRELVVRHLQDVMASAGARLARDLARDLYECAPGPGPRHNDRLDRAARTPFVKRGSGYGSA